MAETVPDFIGERDLPSGPGSRRDALKIMGAAAAIGAAGAVVPAGAQTRTAVPVTLPLPKPVQVPSAELVNVIQYEDQARLKLGREAMMAVAGSDRTVTDRITLRPRINIPTRDLDMTCPLFGDDHFTPIIVGPMADQKRFHPDGAVAIARGASAAKAAMVAAADADLPTVAQALTTPLWVQVYPRSPRTADALAQAGAARAKAVIVTVNAGSASAARIDWAGVDASVRGTQLPVIVKGITRPEDAREAVKRGAKGVVVSNWRNGSPATLQGTLLLIEPVVQAVGDRVPVLADGSFRYGSDILKALGFGAKAVLVGRPISWGLAAYGAEGVQGVVETLQTDLARFMAMCGRPSLALVDRTLVRVHATLPPERTSHV